jgi:hypothetical protein
MGYDYFKTEISCCGFTGVDLDDIIEARWNTRNTVTSDNHSCSTSFHQWRIRSFDMRGLEVHRCYVRDLKGFSVGPIEMSLGFPTHCLPRGCYFFRVEVSGSYLTPDIYAELCRWDRLYGGLDRKE